MLRFRFCFVIVFVKSEMSRFLCWHILNSFECIYFFDFNWAVSMYTSKHGLAKLSNFFVCFHIILKKLKRNNEEK